MPAAKAIAPIRLMKSRLAIPRMFRIPLDPLVRLCSAFIPVYDGNFLPDTKQLTFFIDAVSSQNRPIRFDLDPLFGRVFRPYL